MSHSLMRRTVVSVTLDNRPDCNRLDEALCPLKRDLRVMGVQIELKVAGEGAQSGAARKPFGM